MIEIRSYYPQNEIYTHHIYLRISHIIFRYKDGEGWPPQQTPVFVDEPQLLSDVLGEQSHVMVQVEVRGREDDGIAEHSLASNTIELARAQTTNWPGRPTSETQ